MPFGLVFDNRIGTAVYLQIEGRVAVLGIYNLRVDEDGPAHGRSGLRCHDAHPYVLILAEFLSGSSGRNHRLDAKAQQPSNSRESESKPTR